MFCFTVQAVGSNIVSGNPTSDLNSVFMAARCTLELVSQSQGNNYCIGAWLRL